tara:strand:- start:3791 stop:4645 length:855 start_codon:yes stop_codon:yes gene_type:complete
MNIFLENQAPFSVCIFVCFSEVHRGIPHKLVCLTLKRLNYLLLPHRRKLKAQKKQSKINPITKKIGNKHRARPIIRNSGWRIASNIKKVRNIVEHGITRRMTKDTGVTNIFCTIDKSLQRTFAYELLFHHHFLRNFFISKLKQFQTSYDIFFKRCFLDFKRIAVCIGAIFSIPLHTPLKLIVRSFYRTYQRIFMSDSRGVAENIPIPLTPPKNFVYRGEIPCFIDCFNVDYSVQKHRGNPLSKEGIFYIKEEVLSGGSIGNDFNFPMVSEHTTHFLLFKNIGEI